MTSLNDLLPKRAKFRVIFSNGKKKTLWLRPYTLRDEAYLQKNYKDTELYENLSNYDIELMSKLIWRQLEPKSKAIFDNVTALDDDGNKVSLEGHEKFMECLGGAGGVAQVTAGFKALMECRGLNSYVDKNMEEEALKKKGLKARIMRFFLKP